MGLSFGSDGFRGVIGHDLTREAVGRIILGVADYLRGRLPDEQRGPTVPIGHDTRFLARPFAKYASALLRREGFAPLLCARACPSPYLGFATHALKAPLGLQFTASHNPYVYGGLKLKGPQGGSMVPAEARQIEFYAEHVGLERLEGVPFLGGAKAERAQPRENGVLDMDRDYRAAVLSAAGGVEGPCPPLIVDYMNGAAAGIYRELLGQWFDVSGELRVDPDPLFGGGKPEPRPECLGELAEQVRLNGEAAIGLAFDGDGDRLVAVAETGRVLEQHEMFCLLIEYLVQHRGMSGAVVKTVSASLLIDRVARACGCDVIEVPVGFKHVSDAMLMYGAFIGGEESGGIGFGHYLPERDALLMALMLLKARQAAGAQLSEMVDDLYRRFARPAFVHRDIPLPAGLTSDELKRRLEDLVNLSILAGDSVESINHSDGMKLHTAAGWVLARASGTEHLARLYAEAPERSQAEEYIRVVAEWLGLNPAK